MFFLFSKVSVILNKTAYFFVNYTLFWLALLYWDNATNMLTLSHKMGFFHFTYWLNHYLDMTVYNFILEACILSITLFSFLHSFALIRYEKVSSPFCINHYWFFITKVWAGRISFFTIFTWYSKMHWFILLFIGEYYISWHLKSLLF